MGSRAPARLVLFDLDGTLVDHDGAAARAVEQWVAAARWRPTTDVVAAWAEIAERHFPAYRARETTFQGQRRLRLLEFLPLVGVEAGGWSDERLDDVFADYLSAYEQAWIAFSDAVPCLESVREIVAVAVLSNGDQAQQEDKVRRTGLDRVVDHVLTSDRLGVAKPDPTIFTLACHQLGVAASATVYVGDRLEVDALAASAAGLRGIWLNRGRIVVPADVETITSLADLRPLLTSSP